MDASARKEMQRRAQMLRGGSIINPDKNSDKDLLNRIEVMARKLGCDPFPQNMRETLWPVMLLEKVLEAFEAIDAPEMMRRIEEMQVEIQELQRELAKREGADGDSRDGSKDQP